jgi:hypothetical protein
VDRYYCDFTAQSGVLIARSLILESEANLLFYQGIPNNLRSKVKRKLPATNTKVSSPPTIAAVLLILRKEFDKDDLDADTANIEFSLDSDSDSDSSSDDDSPIRTRTSSPPLKKEK